MRALLKAVHLLAPLPLVEPLLQGQGAVDALCPGAAEQDQGQFGSGQGVGAGVVAVFHLQVEVVDPLVEPGFALMHLRAQHRCQCSHIHKRVLQAVAQAVFEGASEHVLVKRRMKRQYRAITHKVHEIEQGVHRVTACSNGRRPQAMQQYAGAQSVVGTLQGSFKRLALRYQL